MRGEDYECLKLLEKEMETVEPITAGFEPAISSEFLTPETSALPLGHATFYSMIGVVKYTVSGQHTDGIPISTSDGFRPPEPIFELIYCYTGS